VADWLSQMQQTFEYYTVDPSTWKDDKRLTNVKSCSIDYDAESETLGSATFNVTESLGECYIRVYLVTIQNGLTERHPLGTFLVQTPSSNFDGKVRSIVMDAYTPLLELKEKQPVLGYSMLKGENIMDRAYSLCRENMRAPVVKTTSEDTLYSDFVANTNDTWVSFVTDLIANAKFEFDLDERGRVLFTPKQNTASLQPVWTFNDDNSSILYPELTIDHDLYGVPNVVEVIYSGPDETFYSRVVNDDSNSPTSTVNRGREITHRETNPDFGGVPSQEMIDEYAKRLLKTLSSVEYTVTYTHGYCKTRIRDCVRLNYSKADLMNTKAKIVKQTIKCEPGCPVTEKAVYTVNLWG
jgi:hypothetical protein